MTITTNAILAVTAFAAYLITGHILHRRWVKEGEALSAEFDRLWLDRSMTLDRRVMRFELADETEQEAIRDAVLEWFRRMDEHGHRRSEWLARMP